MAKDQTRTASPEDQALKPTNLGVVTPDKSNVETIGVKQSEANKLHNLQKPIDEVFDDQDEAGQAETKHDIPISIPLTPKVPQPDLKPGTIVYYGMPEAEQGIIAYPAMLIKKGGGGLWWINIFRYGFIRGVPNAQYSPVLKSGHWTDHYES